MSEKDNNKHANINKNNIVGSNNTINNKNVMNIGKFDEINNEEKEKILEKRRILLIKSIEDILRDNFKKGRFSKSAIPKTIYELFEEGNDLMAQKIIKICKKLEIFEIYRDAFGRQINFLQNANISQEGLNTIKEAINSRIYDDYLL